MGRAIRKFKRGVFSELNHADLLFKIEQRGFIVLGQVAPVPKNGEPP